MNSIQRFGNRLNTRNLILGLVIWWLVMLIIYSIFTLRVNRLKGELRQSGVDITHEFSNLVSLPLLENNSQSIAKLLTDAANRTDVIYASVVDHRNKVVAFTGTGHLMPDMTAAARSVDKVSMSEGGFASHARILNFVSNITYAGTKIGEIFIGLSTPEMFQTRKQFIFIAVSSGLILLILVAVFRYQTIKAFMSKYLDFNRSGAASNTTVTVNGTLINCPLCGTQQSLSRKLFKQSSLDKFLSTGDWKLESKPGSNADSKRLDMQEAEKKEDLSWIKRQIILRCTEIINKLTA
jgi:hypothetical protein